MRAVVFSCAAGFAFGTSRQDIVEKFEEFRTKWGRSYTGEEYVRRLGWFEKHLQKVELFRQNELGTATYTHLGPFADFSPEEMSHRFGLVQTGFLEEMPTAPILNASLDDSFDWVAKGAVNPVKDQGQCGSCWAFSTACNLEGVGFVQAGKLVSLSEQNIMDCDKTCYSCNGGLPSLALTWSEKYGGVASEASYPYTAEDGSCKPIGTIAHNTGYQKVSQNEDQIAQTLASAGPLSIGVDATPFQSYTSGILNNPSCSQTRLDHAVNIVGYAADGSTKYWKIRNSWSASWGEKGYIRVIRGNCMCGLCTTVVTATGVTISDAPVPVPTPPPTPCTDSLPICPSEGSWECDYVAGECEKSCGCCDPSAHSYCSGKSVVV